MIRKADSEGGSISVDSILWRVATWILYWQGSIGFCTRTVPGSLLSRISSAALGTILGGSVALPLGTSHLCSRDYFVGAIFFLILDHQMLIETILCFAQFLLRDVHKYCFCLHSTGWLQSTLQAELNPAQEQDALHVQLANDSKPKPKYEDGQGVDAVIRRLESRVPDPPLRSHE